MKKYKLLTQEGYPTYKLIVGNIYTEDWQYNSSCLTISEMAKLFPKDWELIDDEFVLPEKWCIAVTKENIESLGKWREAGSIGVMHSNNPSPKGFIHSYNKGYWSSSKMEGYTKITFDQFKKYVLNMKEEKEIIGYKLKSDYKGCRDAALKLCNTIANWENSLMIYDISVKQKNYISKLTEAGVLDLWFEPVYEEITPQITINGYKGEFFDDYVKFGCAQIDKRFIIRIYNTNRDYSEGGGTYSNRMMESITIGKGTFSKEQIGEIAKYFLNKDK